MAYLARIKPQESRAIALEAIGDPGAQKPDFSPLEWSVIRLARVDGLWTIRSSGRLRRWWNRLLGRGNPELANPQLEALRRMAVLTWHYGFTVPGDDIAHFLAAGFSADQYELMASSINSAIGAPRRIAA